MTVLYWRDVPESRRATDHATTTWRGCEAAVQGRTVAPEHWPYWRCSVPALKGTGLCRRHHTMALSNVDCANWVGEGVPT